MKCSVRIIIAAVLSSCALAGIHGAPIAAQRRSPDSNVTGEDALFWADWLPVIAYQPAPSRITIETPAAWESLAQGDLAETRRQGERIARTFVNRAPVSCIMAVAGPYTVRRRTAHGYPLATYRMTFRDR